MGFNFSWIFVEGATRQDLWAALDLAPVQKMEDAADLGTSHAEIGAAKFGEKWQAVFTIYALTLDAAFATNPPRIARLPSKSRCVVCLVLEHAMISYAALWQAGRRVWEIRHNGGQHLDASGDLPSAYPGIRARADMQQLAEDKLRSPMRMHTDYLFDVPLDTATTITGFRHSSGNSWDILSDLHVLQPVDGAEFDRLYNPPYWWQKTNSMTYR
ncbi:MAG: hypothetical protein ABL866_17615 [Devosia sp.]